MFYEFLFYLLLFLWCILQSTTSLIQEIIIESRESSEQVHFGQSWPSLVKLAEVASVFTSSVHHPGLGPLGPGATLDLHS